LRAFDDSALSAHQIKVIDTSINIVASQEGERSLSALYQIIRGQDLDLAERLQPWTRGNRYGDIFDHPEDDFVLSDLCGIEVGGLLDDAHLAPAVQAYLFEVVEDKVGGTIPTFIYLEEGWYLLRNEAFRNRFEDWIKTMRKRNTSVGIATQSMKELRDTPITATLNDNLITRIYVPNYQARDSADVYKDKCGLRDHEVDILRLARQKGQYYIAQNEHRRLVDVVLPADVLALTRSDARAKEAFARWRNSGREDWLQEYIRSLQ
jgi:type IV secretion system protein VirB4